MHLLVIFIALARSHDLASEALVTTSTDVQSYAAHAAHHPPLCLTDIDAPLRQEPVQPPPRQVPGGGGQAVSDNLNPQVVQVCGPCGVQGVQHVHPAATTLS
jgi:hypothetical protein